MGFKAQRVISLVLSCTILLNPISVKADVPASLYAEYGLNFADTYPKECLKTISDYQEALRYPTKFAYVNSVTFDKAAIDNRIRDLTNECNACTKKLENGFSMPLSEIYSVEDEYKIATQRLAEAKNAKRTSTAKSKVDIPPRPTKEDYEEALKVKASYDQLYDIGKVNVSIPITGEVTIKSHSDSSTILSVDKEDCTVSALFKGTVIQATKTDVTIQHPGNIYTHYSGLTKKLVKNKEKVYQGEGIGLSSKQVTIQMKLNGKFVDLSKIITEGKK